MAQTLANTSLKLKHWALRHSRSSRLPHLILMTDEERMPNPESFLPQLPRGACVILRHYNFRNRKQMATRLKSHCERRGLNLIVGGDWQLAAQVDALGLHLPTHLAAKNLKAGARLWLNRRKKLLTVAAHSAKDVRAADALGAAAVLLSPIFLTKSHPSRRPLGPTQCAAISRSAKTGVIALGGVTEKTVNALQHTQCVGIAGISFVLKD